MNKLIKELKDNNQDFEFYPTTKDMVKCVEERLSSKFAYKSFSILDIGAGNGNFFNLLEEIQKENTERQVLTDCKKYAIEKSPILIEKMNPDIIIIGTDFHRQTLIDKNVSVIFCNPPYSEFKTWTEKIVMEASCQYLYLIIPDRWETDEMKDIIERRGCSYKIIGSFDFNDSEYRKARAKVHIIEFNYIDKSNRAYYPEHHAFNVWFDDNFKVNNKNDVKLENKTKQEHKESIREKSKQLVTGQNLIERMEELYNDDMANLMKMYANVGAIDKELLEELGINLSNLRERLKMKIENLKSVYWEELISNLSKITNKLIERSRQAILDKLNANMFVDFTAENAYAIVLWILKNANNYFEVQLKQMYMRISSPDNVNLYKSNKHLKLDEWRYEQTRTHYTLDYRIVLKRQRCFDENSYDFYKKYVLTEYTKNDISDICTIGHQLGFNVINNINELQWEPNKENMFYFKKGDKQEVFMAVKCFKNGNIHIKFNQDFMKKFNIEAGRLFGWVKSPKEAADETGISIIEVKKYYGSNIQYQLSNYKQLI